MKKKQKEPQVAQTEETDVERVLVDRMLLREKEQELKKLTALSPRDKKEEKREEETNYHDNVFNPVTLDEYHVQKPAMLDTAECCSFVQ